VPLLASGCVHHVKAPVNAFKPPQGPSPVATAARAAAPARALHVQTLTRAEEYTLADAFAYVHLLNARCLLSVVATATTVAGTLAGRGARAGRR